MKILQAIIDDFINTAQPVGSRTIAKKYPLGISSATIRNEMADLEDLGYLVQPHTSAGRIPSDMGYRVYVDSLMRRNILEDDQRSLIRGLLLNRIIEIEDVVKQATEILANLTGMTAIISLPQFSKSQLSNMKLIKINDSKALMILVSNTGIVKNIPLALKGSNQAVLDLIADKLLQNLGGLHIEEITVKAISNLKMELGNIGDIIDYLVPILKETLRDLDDLDYSIEGIHSIMNTPEFHDVDKLKTFLTSIEDQRLIRKVFDSIQSEGISVKIGSELKIEEMSGCSMVTASYKFNDKDLGKIAVIGPTRMDYGNAVSIVDYIRETLSDIFSGIYL